MRSNSIFGSKNITSNFRLEIIDCYKVDNTLRKRNLPNWENDIIKKFNSVLTQCTNLKQAHDYLINSRKNSTLFYNGIEDHIKRSYKKWIKKCEGKIITDYNLSKNIVFKKKSIVKTKIPNDQNNDQFRLVSILFYVNENNLVTYYLCCIKYDNFHK